MATPKQLVSVVAKVTGVHEGTVILHDRNLLVAGLRTEAQRGRGRSSASFRDATNLLIAVVGTSNVKDSAYPIQNHGRMMSYEGKWELEFFSIPELISLGPDHTFADAVEALLQSAASGTLQTAYNKAADGQLVDIESEINLPVQIEITLHDPFVWSSIEITEMDYSNPDDGYRGTVEKKSYGRAKREDNLSFDPPLDLTDHGDLRHMHTITHKTLAAVGNALRD